jgi:type II secretory pathway pseudopilin PulG
MLYPQGRKMAGRRRRGFTLVLLLPALGTARERAARTACLSNLRQAYQALALYAHDHRRQVPLGYRRAKQFNSMLYSATAGRFVLFGHLYLSNLLRDGRAFYCPTESNPAFQFDTPGNPWPAVDTTPTRNIQLGYSMRPEVEIPDLFTPDTRLPRLDDFKSRAILADTTAARVRLETRHRAGVNLIRGDGSGAWAERKLLVPAIDLLPEPQGAPDTSWDDEMDAVWSGLDRR